MASALPLDARALNAALGRGTSAPLGARPTSAGVNFSVLAKQATAVELLLFDGVDDARPARAVRLKASTHRTQGYWHVFVPELMAGQLYGYRVFGPWDPGNGLRFDSTKVLLDPYGRAVVVPEGYDRSAACQRRREPPTPMKSVVVDVRDYDWEGDAPLRRASARTIVYEMHVRGFTRSPSSGVAEERRGTYAGVVDKIPYLEQLGISAVELLPVFHFDAQDCPPGRVNYWGYAPLSFFAPHPAYSSRRDPLGAVCEFRDMVKALHRAGIEVILDVVYNHTAEGDENGPTVCYRGFHNTGYYILEPSRGRYSNYSGTGNTLNANHPIVRRLIVDSLRYWVEEMHVDGFRFDLASILSRDECGRPMGNPPILWDIESDPVLAGTKLMAEAWDAAGLYQVGSFVGDYWKEWNGRFRDDARDFFRGADGSAARFADRMIGSPDVFAHERREAEQSVNFVTCHDGFTLNDLVSYNAKHNEANGEGNRDGCDDNRSWNCGAEGPSGDPEIEKLRNRQVKNFFVATLLSIGVPMILMGDEMRRMQRGNNNAYCCDDETTWLDWSLLEKHADVHRFVRLINERRRLRGIEREGLTLADLVRRASIEWHGVRLFQPDWGPHSHSIAFTLRLRRERLVIHFAFNAYWEALEFELPFSEGLRWRRWIDTSLDSPADVVRWQAAPPHVGATYRAGPRSSVVLFASPPPTARLHPPPQEHP